MQENIPQLRVRGGLNKSPEIVDLSSDSATSPDKGESPNISPMQEGKLNKHQGETSCKKCEERRGYLANRRKHTRTAEIN